MLGVKAPNYDIYGLYRAMLFHIPTLFQEVLNGSKLERQP